MNIFFKTLNRVVTSGAVFLALALPLNAQAADTPEALIKSVSSEVLAIVSKNKDEISGSQRQKIVQQIAAKIEPHFNFMHMAKLAVGKHWKHASAEQQKQVANEFRILLNRTYSRALSDYDNQTIEVLEPRKAASGDEARVKTEIRKPGAKPVLMDYYLEKIDGAWKAFDIEVEGVSLITNYREEFNGQINNSGIDGLIKSLKEKNASNSAK